MMFCDNGGLLIVRFPRQDFLLLVLTRTYRITPTKEAKVVLGRREESEIKRLGWRKKVGTKDPL
jgi:hypothetical protein